jgi:hypothetical protein
MRTQPPGNGSALRDAEEWLRNTLTEPIPATKISEMPENAGISKKTLRRASESLGVVKGKTGMRAGWERSFPPKMTVINEDAQQNCMDTFG